VRLSKGDSVIGGGSCPESQLLTTLITLESGSVRPSLIESRLRSQDPPVILRVEEDKVLIDLRTVFPAQESVLIRSLQAAILGRQ
jgi:L-seryl-tRNA(Ser) seleniumtransferase